MRKKFSLFLLSCFIFSFVFSFALADVEPPPPPPPPPHPCCDLPPLPGCQASRGHLIKVGEFFECVKDYTDTCDVDGNCG